MKSSSFVRSIATVGALSVMACGPASDEPGDESIASIEEAATFTDRLPPGIKKAAAQAKEIMGLVNGVREGIAVIDMLGTLFGLWEAAPDPFAELTSQINTGILAVSWQSTLQHVDLARSYSDNAIGSLRAQMVPYDAGSPAAALIDSNTRMATTLMGVRASGTPDLQNSGFMRVQNETATDGAWKNVISDRAGTTPMAGSPSTLLVYDWRLGVPALLDIVAKRTTAIAWMDPTFASAANREELMNLRRTVLGHQQRMSAGVKCSHRFVSGVYVVKPPAIPTANDYGGGSYRVPVPRRAFTLQVACADIYTGTSLYEARPWTDAETACRNLQNGVVDAACVAKTNAVSVQALNTTVDTFRRKLRGAMPFFEMQSVIDSLYVYAHAERDLAQQFEEIPLSSSPPHLCLETIPNAPRNFTGSRVRVDHCRYSWEQWFKYDRKTGTVHSPTYDVCLEVAPYSDVLLNINTPGAAVNAALCDRNAARQHWTYNPETKTLLNELGTVLGVATLAPGAAAATADLVANEPKQSWRAEEPFALDPPPPASCGVLNPGEGLTAGEELRSCNGTFALQLAADGNLALYQRSVYNPPGLPPGVISTLIWQTGTSGLLGSVLEMTSNGNLVMYNWLGGAVWHTNTANRPGATLKLEDNGSLRVMDTSARQIWSR